MEPTMKFKFAISNVCSAFSRSRLVIGTKVVYQGVFTEELSKALASHDTSGDRTPGQHFVMLDNEVIRSEAVSAGVGERAGRMEGDYVVRMHRGRAEAFLKREHAAIPTGVAAVVYTLDAYKADPEVDAKEVASFPEGTTHVIVAVLAFAGPRAPLTPYRLVSNLAGGNKDMDNITLDEVKAMARDIKAYDDAWCVVSD